MDQREKTCSLQQNVITFIGAPDWMAETCAICQMSVQIGCMYRDAAFRILSCSFAKIHLTIREYHNGSSALYC